jgi:pyruvate/2-oxoglutarate/acetoin dehydrogenase E1 component
MQENTARCVFRIPEFRRATILGQAIGMALRGLRLAEIQCLDYLLYRLTTNVRRPGNSVMAYKGGQRAPLIFAPAATDWKASGTLAL